MEQIQNKLKEKMPQIEAIFGQKESPIKLSKTGPGTYKLMQGQAVMELTDEQMKGVEIYLNLTTIFTADDFKDSQDKGTSPSQ